jgi:hypothetical protein
MINNYDHYILWKTFFFIALCNQGLLSNSKAALDVVICFYQNFSVSFDILFNSKNEPKKIRV